tara:strand:- start:437 stop:601 length:165 start_codon:yes stop_codon:yes gene_type:complete
MDSISKIKVTLMLHRQLEIAKIDLRRAENHVIILREECQHLKNISLELENKKIQ